MIINGIDSKQANKLVGALANCGSNLESILEGFILYDENKGVLDPEVYEETLAMYRKGISAMREQLDNLFTLVVVMQRMLKFGE
jgi:hypothetical protein